MNKTQKLREEIAIIVASCGYRSEVALSNCDACIYFDEENIVCKYPVPDQVLEVCKRLGLVFIVEDAELPEGVFNYEQHKRIFKEAGWEKTEKIELT